MRKGKLTYEDFKIGEYVTCVKVDDWTQDQHLTIGKKYKITDLDFHFPNSVCIKCDGKLEMFMNLDYFEDIKQIRKIKLDKINKNGG